MNTTKCQTLKDELAYQPAPQFISVEKFFDGNDDPASIGCNLIDHPGVERFRELFDELLRRPDVQAIYALISELDPGEDCWPFADTILVVGTISIANLSKALQALQPDDVSVADHLSISATLAKEHGAPVLAVWWD